MQVIDRNELKIYKQDFYKRIKSGKIFIYPTDTIYGLGCDATNAEAVKKIREIKERTKSPFSVIAPSKKWIKENCEITKKRALWKLPGKYTIIFKLKNKNAVAKEVNPGMNSLGVRIPKHWASKLAKETNLPIITTSVNKQGEEYLKVINDIPLEIKGHIDFAIDEGPIEGSPSTLINTTTNEVIKR
ncbi:Sua5/YciO/YrdC/YwlC family protein [Candidatus Woesearchaeota archaeon]|jgi:L-threonylcarbamoyladenylate synthase|nr:Sua5/YciO/YrdC/YwlC family protein [Candidatus Woesearchaeota archaeon]MBT3304807.1 Sua5/YciO/YrdC/YwlC family protein [Candidatus Woesearchaeota archaeon]MBT4367857.1 Sua5/YciO/YrdC/YwlC family protein [Candidatus Woesearchaeota archaeon]MBT4712345.1 Sua5/YciO/YrdC/YwlC family protein [Candidatus Woesearchaeota archaeon]MBT6639257.1 Sua5/YciO/YrdC/YwlC family protein [Candidatus Woesearchaeota archaeon]